MPTTINKMKPNLDLKSLALGMLLGAIITTATVVSIAPKRVESWHYRTIPTEVLEKQLKERILQAIEEGWTLAYAPHGSRTTAITREL